MARFETPWQVASLFLCAALVSVAVIFVLKAEAHKRYGNHDGAAAREAAVVPGADAQEEGN